MTRTALPTLLLCAALGCATRTVRVDPRALADAQAAATEVAQADALVHAGCYRCLLDAFTLYEGARTRLQPPQDLRQRRLTVALLLALREKELGLSAARWIETAAALAGPGDQTYLDIVRATPWQRAGSSVDFEAPTRARPEDRARWTTALSGAAARSVLDQYMLITVMCGMASGTPSHDTLPLALLDLNQPILQYRVGICSAGESSHLERALALEPRFLEASFFLGRYELGGVFARRDWLTRALPLLAAAHEALPEVPIVAVAYAGALRARGALARALAAYDEALAVLPAQREALLGKVVTLTYLDRPEDAIAAATRMIELGTWYVGDANYWRALNRYQTGDVTGAAADVATARRTLINGDVATLAGRIAYDQHRSRDARADFSEARRLDSTNCTAAWYLGLLDIDDEAWRSAITMSASAADCYTAAAEGFRIARQQLPDDLPADARQQQTADYDRRIADSRRQAARSSFNAAQASLRIGDTGGALGFARAAAMNEDMHERASALIRRLEPGR